jgi:RND family efflux transporter MFP subunit
MNHKLNLISIAVLSLLLSGCGEPSATNIDTEQAPPLSLLAADLYQLSTGEFSQGPMISGSLQPVIKAELNAEVSGIVTQVFKDNGDLVKAGELLVQLDQTTYRDKLMSAQEAERSALLTSDQAAKQLRRMQSLHKQNLVTAEVLEAAEIKTNQAQSELASAKARLVEARQQMERTAVRAPFSGVVAQRKTSAGDTAQVGKALMVVIDPTSMRFEGFIAADQVGQVKVGQQVSFKVNGYNQQFHGQIERINPQANEMTRQVQVFVGISEQESLVAGLYAEGYISVAMTQSLMVPPSALVQEGDHHFVWQLNGDTLQKTAVTIGDRDPRWGTVQLLSGVSAGAEILRHPQGTISNGVKVLLPQTVAGSLDKNVTETGKGSTALTGN